MIAIVTKIAVNTNTGMTVAKIMINFVLLLELVSPLLLWYKLPFELNTYVERPYVSTGKPRFKFWVDRPWLIVLERVVKVDWVVEGDVIFEVELLVVTGTGIM